MIRNISNIWSTNWLCKNNRFVFHPEEPVIENHQKSSNSCCLSILASYFHFIRDNRAITALVNHIEYSLALQTDEFRNIIHFDNAIMTNKTKIKGEQNLR